MGMILSLSLISQRVCVCCMVYSGGSYGANAHRFNVYSIGTELLRSLGSDRSHLWVDMKLSVAVDGSIGAS